MSRPALFLDHEYKLSFEKIAMPVKLSDSPESWQREIATEIFKQIPYIAEYAVNVVLDRVDPERGFAFGSAHVAPKSQMPTPEQKDLPEVRIPLIVKDRLLLPLDVFMDGAGVFPLSEARLREKLMRSETFETSTRRPGDQGMVDQLYPPFRTNYGLGAAQGDAMGMGKMASNPAEKARKQMVRFQHAQAAANPADYMKYAGGLVEAIAPTIPEREADAFVESIASDPALAAQAAKNETFSKLALTIASAPRAGVEKTAQALVESIRPTVVQLQKLASGDFKVKWANANAFMPQEGTVDPSQAQEMAGADLGDMQAGDAVTVSTEKAKKDSLDEPVFKVIEEFGVYKVQNLDTNQMSVGHAIPIVDFDLHPLEMFVWTDGQSYGVQDEIAGQRVGHDVNLPFSEPQGDGVFVLVTEGGAQCLLPMTINHTSQGPDGSLVYNGETLFGEPVNLTVAPGLEGIQQLNDFEYALSGQFQWLPLQNPVFLAKNPLDIEQVQEAQKAPSTVEVGSTGAGEFSMDGQPLAKIAREQKQFLKTAEAEFLLVGMGMNPFEARSLLKQAEYRGKVKVAGLRPLRPLSDLHREMTKKASKILADFPYDLRRNLVKEAAMLQDAETADKVLAMNFINPENISTFAGYLPQLDEASGKLAELLVAARLGLSQVDEGAVERAMKNLEGVIEGLKGLQQKELL